MGSMLNLFRVLCAAFMFMAMSPIGDAQETRDVAANTPGAEMVLQTYEIGDLVFAVPDYTLETGRRAEAVRSVSGFAHGGMGGRGMAGGGGFGGGGFGAEGGGGVGARGEVAPAPGPAPLTMESVLQVIQATVAPDSWSVSGGEGRATALGTALVVRQTPDAQQAISQLLDALRGGSARRRSMTIDARWLLLDSDSLEKLVVVGDDGETTINREALAELTRQPTSLRGFVSCFSGQAVYLTSGTVRSNVSSYIPVVGSVEAPKPEIRFASHAGDSSVSFVSDEQQGGAFGGRSVGYQPVVTTNNFGVQVELRPTRLYPEKAAIIDLRSTITFPASPSSVGELDSMTSDLAPQVDRLAIQTQELATTLRVPLGEPVLVGGMTDMSPRLEASVGDATVDPAAATGEVAEKPQLYLILEVR